MVRCEIRLYCWMTQELFESWVGHPTNRKRVDHFPDSKNASFSFCITVRERSCAYWLWELLMGQMLAIVTGASSGIGYELAKDLARRGYDLIVASAGERLAPAAEDYAVPGSK